MSGEAGEQIDRDFAEVEAWADALRTALMSWADALELELETWSQSVELSGAAATAVATHEASADPHPIYLTQTEADARYDLLGSDAAAIGRLNALNAMTGGI